MSRLSFVSNLNNNERALLNKHKMPTDEFVAIPTMGEIVEIGQMSTPSGAAIVFKMVVLSASRNFVADRVLTANNGPSLKMAPHVGVRLLVERVSVPPAIQKVLASVGKGHPTYRRATMDMSSELTDAERSLIVKQNQKPENYIAMPLMGEVVGVGTSPQDPAVTLFKVVAIAPESNFKIRKVLLANNEPNLYVVPSVQVRLLLHQDSVTADVLCELRSVKMPENAVLPLQNNVQDIVRYTVDSPATHGLVQQMDALRQLQNNWDGDGAPAPSAEAFTVCETVIGIMQEVFEGCAGVAFRVVADVMGGLGVYAFGGSHHPVDGWSKQTGILIDNSGATTLYMRDVHVIQQAGADMCEIVEGGLRDAAEMIAQFLLETGGIEVDA
jgi:hypothetical protein